MKSPFLKILKNDLKTALSNLLYLTLILAGGLDKAIASGAFQTQLFCDPVEQACFIVTGQGGTDIRHKFQSAALCRF